MRTTALVILAAILASACGGGGPADPVIQPPAIEGAMPPTNHDPAACPLMDPPSPRCLNPRAEYESARCFNPDLYRAGAHHRFSYRVHGAETGRTTMVRTVLPAVALFSAGAPLVTPVVQRSEDHRPGQADRISERTTYLRVEGTNIIEYGYDQTLPSQLRSRYLPALRDLSFALDAAENFEASFSAHFGAGSIPDPQYVAVRYLGMTQVTVPAGSYMACKFEVQRHGSTTTTWVSEGSGLTVKLATAYLDGFITYELEH